MRREEILKPRIHTEISEDTPVVRVREIPLEKPSFADANARAEFGLRPEALKPMLGPKN